MWYLMDIQNVVFTQSGIVFRPERNQALSTTWMNLEDTTLSEISQSKKTNTV
jgi:hypothetical protein